MEAARSDGRAGRNLREGDEPLPGYRLTSRLGRGGFGEVWKAEAPGGFDVALKFVDLADDRDTPELRSIDIVRRIRHAHLLTLFGSWRIDDRLILGMELADQTLADRLRGAQAEGLDGLPEDELLGYMEQAADGLDYLNGRNHVLEAGKPPVGIQHRDVKPQNLLLVGRSLKVSDFGLARVLERSLSGHTGKGWSVAYAPPEYLSHQTSDRSDQYSLAVTYCHLRGGRLPFTGNPAQMMAGHALHTPDLSMLDPREHEAVARALAKNPQARWADCRSFVEAVRRSRSAPVQPAWKRPAKLSKPRVASAGLGTSGWTPHPRPAAVKRAGSRSIGRTIRLLPIVAILIGGVWCVVDLAFRPTRVRPYRPEPAESTSPLRVNVVKDAAPVLVPSRMTTATLEPSRPAELVGPPVPDLAEVPRKALAADRFRRAADAAASDLERRNAVARHLAAKRGRDLDQLTARIEALRGERDFFTARNQLIDFMWDKARLHHNRAMLPYKTAESVWKRPVVVDCRESQAALFTVDDPSKRVESWNSDEITRQVSEFDHLANEIQSYLANVARQPTPDGGPCSPFLLLCVNPKGARTFRELAKILRRLGIPYEVEPYPFFHLSGGRIVEGRIVIVPKLEDLSAWSVDRPAFCFDGPLYTFKPGPRSGSIRRSRTYGVSRGTSSGVSRLASASLAAGLDRASPVGPTSLRNWLSQRAASSQAERDAERSKFDAWRVRDWPTAVSPFAKEQSLPPKDKELHFELKGGRVTFVYLDRLLELVKADGKVKKAEGRGLPIRGEVGPIGAFSVRYDIEPRSGDAAGTGYEPGTWEVVPQGSIRGEDVREVMRGPSELDRVLKTLGSDRTLVTILVYPDSYLEFQLLRDWLNASGRRVGCRLLDEGAMIQSGRPGNPDPASVGQIPTVKEAMIPILRPGNPFGPSPN